MPDVVLIQVILLMMAHGCSKHVEYQNKHIRKELCVRLVIYKNYTETHGQQNLKLWYSIGTTNYCTIILGLQNKNIDNGNIKVLIIWSRDPTPPWPPNY